MTSEEGAEIQRLDTHRGANLNDQSPSSWPWASPQSNLIPTFLIPHPRLRGCVSHSSVKRISCGMKPLTVLTTVGVAPIIRGRAG